MKMLAVLRGVNVGRGNRVAMADLRQLAESLGWRDVSTVLATGNLIFSAPRLSTARAGATLERALRVELGLTTRVRVLTADEVGVVMAENPLETVATNPSRLVGTVFLEPAARDAVVALTDTDWSPGALVVGTHAAYLWCPDGILASPAANAVSRAARDGVTSRNWATWQKMAAALLPRRRH